MCGRFALSKSDRIDWAQFGVRRGPQLPPHWNLGPGRDIAAVRNTGDGHQVAMLRWGLIPFWAGDPSIGARLANARVESAAEKPAFRAAFRQRRCLIPADGFYEWTGTARDRRPIWFHLPDRGLLLFAGLFDEVAAGRMFTILTAEAGPDVAPVHDRMPVVVPLPRAGEWLDGEGDGLLAPAPAGTLVATEVSRRANSVQNDDPGCLIAAQPEHPGLGGPRR